VNLFDYAECSYLLCKEIANECRVNLFNYAECSYLLCKEIANECRANLFDYAECSYLLCKGTIIWKKNATFKLLICTFP